MPTLWSAGSPAARRPGSRWRPRCSGSPSCWCSTSRPSASTRCCGATCGSCSAAWPTRGYDAPGQQPRHGRGRAVRPAAPHARRPPARRRHPAGAARPHRRPPMSRPPSSRLVDEADRAEHRAPRRARHEPRAHPRHRRPRPAPAAPRPPDARADARRPVRSRRRCSPGSSTARRRLRRDRRTAARHLPLRGDVPRDECRDPARADLRHPRAAAHDAARQARPAARLRARVRRSSPSSRRCW